MLQSGVKSSMRLWIEMDFPNKLLVDCFLKHEDKYLLVKRKNSEKWFPGYFGSLWREVVSGSNPYQTLNELFLELGIKPVDIKLKAIANNVFLDLKETFNVFLFVVEVDEKIDLVVPEGEETKWMTIDEMQNNEKVLTEYKQTFPKYQDDKVLFYHTKYDFDKILDFEIFNEI